MSDDNTLDPRVDADEESIVEQPGGARNASDPTPADETDHAVWRRPEQSISERTSEVVGAIHDETPAPVHPLSRQGARRATPPAERTAAAPAAAPTPAPAEAAATTDRIPTEHMAAVIGARGALGRTADPGASLDHEPDVLAEETRPERPAILRLLPWIAGALALALVVAGVVFASTRKPTIVVTPTPTPSVSTPEPVTEAGLMSLAEAEKLAPKQGWKIASTLSRLETATPRIACLASTTGQPNPTATRQRLLTTTAKTGLAARHQIDGFANPAEAAKAFEMRAKQMTTCGDVPTWLAGADKVTGLGNQASSVTIAYQDAVSEYHTVVLSRTGTVIEALEVIQANQPVPAKQVVTAMAPLVNRVCTPAAGTCARTPDATPTGPAATDAPGWLIPSDLPRVTPGAGLWSTTETQPVTTQGSQCENMTLASAAGPTKRDQRTYLMTQDSAAPQTFGIDAVVMTFPTPAAAQAFAKTLNANLASCTTRIQKSVISDAQAATTTIDGSVLATSTQMVTLPLLNGAQTVRYRTAVVVNGTHVVYLVNNPGPSYDLGKEKFLQIAQRAGQRAGQAQ